MLSRVLLVDYCSLPLHRAWPYYTSVRTASSNVKVQPRKPSVPSSPEPLKPEPKKPSASVKSINLIDDTRSLAIKYDHLGFHWEPLNGLISLTEEERTNCLQATKKGRASIEQAAEQNHLRNTVAVLQHACHIVTTGRSHLQSLVEGVLHNGGPERSLLSDDLKDRINRDLKWWEDLLEKKGDITKISALRQGKLSENVHVDASPGGLAIDINGKWSNRRWKKGLNPDTIWGEATVVEVAVRYLVTKYRKGSHFTIFCDNTTVVDGWTLGRRNAQTDEPFLSILHILVQHNCWLSLEWIPSSMNRADAPSRSMISMNLEHPMIE